MANARDLQDQDPFARYANMPDIMDAICQTLSAVDKINLAQVSAVAREHLDRAGYPAMARTFTVCRENLHPLGHVRVQLYFQPFHEIFYHLVQTLTPAIMEAEEFHPWPGWHYGPRPNIIVVIVKNATEGTLLVHVR